MEFLGSRVDDASVEFSGDDEQGASSSDEDDEENQPTDELEAQHLEFKRIERGKIRKEKRKAILNKWFKEMKYIDIKKVLIRLKSRKFLAQ